MTQSMSLQSPPAAAVGLLSNFVQKAMLLTFSDKGNDDVP